MKSKLLALAFGMAAIGSAIAVPVPAIPAGPGFLKFNNLEQIAVAPGATTCYQAFCTGAQTAEINWGVFVTSTVNKGKVVGVNDIASTGPAVFSDITNGQITGIFYGARALTAAEAAGTTDPFPAKGGFIDLYYRDAATYGGSITDMADLAIAGPAGVRTAFDKAVGFTQGTLLAHLEFASGVDPLSSDVFISGSTVPTLVAPFFSSGLANSFANVVLGSGGALETLLDSDFFTTAFGTRDFRFKNSYLPQASWNDLGRGIVGAASNDPATFVKLPEPGSMALVGVGLLGLAAMRRRKV